MDISFFLDILFPPVCLLCAAKLKRGALCAVCAGGIPLLLNAPRRTNGFSTCAAAPYDHPGVKNLIHHLKFGGIKGAATPLSALLQRYAERTHLDLHDRIVIPIPLSKKRERRRGFNQSALIAQRFAKDLSLPFAPEYLHRIKHKKPQSETKDLEERLKNVQGCFRAAPLPPSARRLLLIDDVTTSGATFKEAAAALQAAGAADILAFAVAAA